MFVCLFALQAPSPITICCQLEKHLDVKSKRAPSCVCGVFCRRSSFTSNLFGYFWYLTPFALKFDVFFFFCCGWVYLLKHFTKPHWRKQNLTKTHTHPSSYQQEVDWHVYTQQSVMTASPTWCGGNVLVHEGQPNTPLCSRIPLLL